MKLLTECPFIIILIQLSVILASNEDEADLAFHRGYDAVEQSSTPADIHDRTQHKDRVLLRDVKSLTFFRNKRTTSRRTHTIHQLSCVGGTAGCKLFTPDSVECENQGPGRDDKLTWRCRAEMSDRVKFNHVEVICEGYDYAEDDFILVGSCGLEFTLDYADPLDYHHHSYFKHMDEHEKEMHHERVRQRMEAKKKGPLATELLQQVTDSISANLLLILLFSLLVLVSFILVKYFSSRTSESSSRSKSRSIVNYGPLTSAVMTTKKAC